jgi:hypothetical protein
MVERENNEKQPEKKAAKKASAGSKKPAAKKNAVQESKKPAAKRPEAAVEKPPVEEEAKVTPEEEKEVKSAAEEKEEELSEEEFRRMVEESLEKVTVPDIVLTMMNELASVGYMKMGLPESVNLKHRDFVQARLAIDTLEAMLKGVEGKMPEESLQPFRGTLANLQMNFVQLKRV